jgi:hypothetical protein
MKHFQIKTLLWLSIFAIAMGFLESSVVIYLRELYYPSGFEFPLKVIPPKIAMVEIWREAATIIMLIGAGYMAGKSALTRFAYFLIAFAVWDIFYYVFVFIGWPVNLFTWDILFLIPAPWTGPVIAPCLVALGMIVFGLSILYANANKTSKVTGSQWFLLIGGVVIIISSFLYDYFVEVQLSQASFFPTQQGLLNELKNYIPTKFNWSVFFIGLLCSSLGTFFFIQKNTTLLKTNNYEKK